MRISSGFIPRSPAISARSVPCPPPVAANDPLKLIMAFTGSSPSIVLVTYPILTAPAVWELDGPTITGPRISNMFIFYFSILIILAATWRHIRPTDIFKCNSNRYLFPVVLHPCKKHVKMPDRINTSNSVRHLSEDAASKICLPAVSVLILQFPA